MSKRSNVPIAIIVEDSVERERALNERERRINEREKRLNERERILNEREQNLYSNVSSDTDRTKRLEAELEHYKNVAYPRSAKLKV
jgi:hypothetical protein